MILVYVLAGLFIIMAVLLLLGKGDMLIAGYNTASPQEREQYDIRRLRLLIALVLIISAVGMVLMALWPEKIAIAFSFIVIFICLLTVILANTWAKKKDR